MGTKRRISTLGWGHRTEGPLTAIGHQLAGLVAHYGLPALFVTITLETLGAPLPGESAVIVASAAAAAGELDIRAVALTAFAAAVLGDNIGYLIGRRFGRGAILKAGGRFGITEAALARAEAVARRWGPLMVVAARFVVLLRQLNGLVAGTTGMPWPRFLAANMVGAALWVGVWTTLAYRFGHRLDVVPQLWHHLSLVAAVAIPALVLALAAMRYRHRRG
jgi:membrane protein DedA with SNARE-associated domain